jgi:hypothetical protein
LELAFFSFRPSGRTDSSGNFRRISSLSWTIAQSSKISSM